MTANKSFKILSLEAKDLYAAMNLVNPQPEGYSIRDKNGNISLKKFENTLDWSLDTIKLQDAYTTLTATFEDFNLQKVSGDCGPASCRYTKRQSVKALPFFREI